MLVGLARWRWKMVNRQLLTDKQCDEFSQSVIADLFENVPDANVIVPIADGYWRQMDLSDSEWIYLCRWMNGRGRAATPQGWGWIDIILNKPPSGLALTRKAMDLETNSRRGPDISIGDGNGPINISGQQILISGHVLSGDELLSLVSALRGDAQGLPEVDASAAHQAANSLQGVAEGQLAQSSPDAAGALKWVQNRASEAVGTAGGAALWAGTVSVAKALGWV